MTMLLRSALFVIASFICGSFAGMGSADAQSAITSLTLINADTDQPIPGHDPLVDGAVLNLLTLPTRNLNIRANTSPATVGSVKFNLNGNASFSVESSAPYALAGDNPPGNYAAWTPILGVNTLTATPYSGAGGTGTPGTAQTINFNVIEESSGSAGSGTGAFTNTEKNSLMRLYRAMQHLLGALTDFASGITSTYTDASNNAVVGQGTSELSAAVDRLNKGLSGLLGVITEATDTPTFNTLAAMSRPQQVVHAYSHLDGALGNIDRALVSWNSALTRKTDPVYQDWVRHVITPLQAARSEILAFDRGLGYLNFYPNPRTPGGFNTIVGPHGNYDLAMWKLWRSIVYFTRAITDVAEAVKRGSPTGSFAQLGRPYLSLAQANRNSLFAQMIVSGALPTDRDRFFLVLDGLKALTDDAHPGTPVALHFLSFEWQSNFLPKLGRDPAWDALIFDAIVFTIDAWKHSDGAAWQTMIFPDCSILSDPTGCGGR